MILIATLSTGGTYLTTGNMLNVGERAAAIGIVALGQMLVILTGGLDMSVSGIVAVGYCVTHLLSLNEAIPMPMVILLMILATTACGAINGFLVSRTRVPPFMITLGTFMAFQSLAYVLSSAAKLNFQAQQKWMIQTLGLSGTAGRLFPTILWITISIIVIFTLAFSRFGKNIFQTGGRELAAKMSGINTGRIKFLVYTLGRYAVRYRRAYAGIPASFLQCKFYDQLANCVHRGGHHRRREPQGRRGQRVRHVYRRVHHGIAG